MSDTPQPRANSTADDDTDAFLDALAEKYGNLNRSKTSRTVVIQPPPDDRYFTPKTSRA